MRYLLLPSLLAIALSYSALHAADDVAARPNVLILMADNWAWPHASACGDPVVSTPTFDRLAREGMLFDRAYCAVPSCAPARAVLLTGQAAHRLEEAASLQGKFPAKFPVLPDLLEAAGYTVGYSGKGWGPGRWQESGRSRNPGGNLYESFDKFLADVPPGEPYFFWHNSKDPHVPWETGRDFLESLDEEKLVIPAHLPDDPAVRQDLLGYYSEVQNFDRDCGRLLETLRARGDLDNTLVIMTGDNGWQMPRGLAHVYDLGTHVPMVVRWPGHVAEGSRCEAFVNFDDFAPTLLELAGEAPLPEMTGRSIISLLRGEPAEGRDAVFLERERHANVREGNLCYPCRVIRTADYLYIQNLRPDRLPSGDPEVYWAVDRYGDVDGSLTKELLLSDPSAPELNEAFQLTFGRRPAEELYDLRKDPGETVNVAGQSEYAEVQAKLRQRLIQWREDTDDPRLAHDDDHWDQYPYYGTPKPDAMVLAEEIVTSSAERDGEHDEVRVIFTGVTPNKLVCDTTLREMPDGSWVMVMLGGADAEPRPGNGVFITRSLDQGRTWSEMERITFDLPQDKESRSIVPSELTVHDGRCMLWISTHNGSFDNWKSWVVTSDDSCRTWSTPTRAPGKLADKTFVRNSIVTRDGRLMLPYQHHVGRPSNIDPRNGVIISTDGGRTWSVHGNIRLDESDTYRSWAEANIVELSDGTIAMLIRADRKKVLYRADSHDGGLTWPEYAQPTDIPNPGSKATLYGLPDGGVALLHNPNPKERNPLALWVSFDDLRTWPYRRVLVDTPGRLNYPDGFVGRDGQMLHFAFDDNRYRAVYVGARLPMVYRPEKTRSSTPSEPRP